VGIRPPFLSNRECSVSALNTLWEKGARIPYIMS
jgi:hypothetical protein